MFGCCCAPNPTIQPLTAYNSTDEQETFIEALKISSEAVLPAFDKNSMKSGYEDETPLPGSQFSFTVAKQDGESVGLEVDLVDSVTAVVVKIGKGVVMRHNAERPSRQVRPYDRIIQVNGEKGNARAMIGRLKEGSEWTLVVQRPCSFIVTIDRGFASNLGMELMHARLGTSLLVTKVLEGPMRDWNKSHPEQPVREGDRIVELNGSRGEADKLLRDSEGVDKMVLVFHRFSPCD